MLTKSFGFACAIALASQASIAQAQQGPDRGGASVPASTYRINSGDQLEIYVWGEERLQRTVKVLPDGTIAFPLIGQIRAQSLLPQELEQVIRDGLKDQYRGEAPQVTVSVTSPSGIEFSVIGQVNGPGTFSPGRYVNVLEALSMAGGPDEFAKLDDIVIIRNMGGQLRAIRVQIGSLLKGNVKRDQVSYERLPRIETGDVIIVP
ncbi:sugar transporter [Altererythrobacter salegens]|uniref:Sugar transporter n=2 Tax=Croceibacterium salegens TaxID=1737568 RepID=A0A6I4T238_9SPHN|nr:sugar transporter [Croceibacterium salegens]